MKNQYVTRMKLRCGLLLLFILSTCFIYGRQIYDMTHWGIVPGSREDMALRMKQALMQIRKQAREGEEQVLNFAPGIYHFYSDDADVREYYISNHDQTNPKKVGIALEGMNRLIFQGNGSVFLFHGQMLPLSLLNSTDCMLKDFSIDFVNPHIAQVEIVENDGVHGITFRPSPWVSYRISKDSLFETHGRGWSLIPMSGIAFDAHSRHIVYRTGDLSCNTKGCYTVSDSLVHAPRWIDKRLPAGTVVVMRTWDRPAPGIFLSNCSNVSVRNVTVHYAQGMGLLAQVCQNVTLDGFKVCLKGDADRRFFTTQADATHFSQCKGRIVSVNGLYEGMMDDAINVHGIYLKLIKRIDDYTVIARYMHEQAWGFQWGMPGDSVKFVYAPTMEMLQDQNCIERITAVGNASIDGAKEFCIRFANPLPKQMNQSLDFGIENMTWTPEVYFAHNVVRNNRARGSLFSTPRQTIVERNVFDHTAGSAILLCGDCNGWYETGACRDVLIRENHFINALTNEFQFTNAVISIYPEIPDLEHQTRYFHGGTPGAIRITDNVFDTFDAPVLYAKSVDGLIFKKNMIRSNNEYKPFHWNTNRFLFEKVNHVEIVE